MLFTRLKSIETTLTQFDVWIPHLFLLFVPTLRLFCENKKSMTLYTEMPQTDIYILF